MGMGIFFIVLMIYLLPSFVAQYRKHRNENAIFVLNLFLGWTFIGWVGALIWASTDNIDPDKQRPIDKYLERHNPEEIK